MGISEPTHTGAWRVGKKGIDEKGESTDYAFPDNGNKEGILEEKSNTQEDRDFLGG